MPLKITCPNCRKPSRFDAPEVGALVTCSECGKRLRVAQRPQPKPVPVPLKPELVDDDEPPPLEPTAAPTPGPLKPELVDDEEPLEELEELEPLDGPSPASAPPPMPPSEEGEPDDPDAGAEPPQERKARKLGLVLASFPITQSNLMWRTVFGVVICLGGLTLVVLGIVACVDIAKTSVGQALLGLLLCEGFGAATLVLGGYLLLRMARDRGKKVLLSSKGFAVVQRGKRSVYHWKDVLAQYQSITEIYHNDISVRTAHVYTLECVGGERFVFDDSLKNVKKLGEAIAEQITERELPAVRERYDAGDLVPFGKLALSRKGLTYGKSFLPWREVSGVRINQGQVSVGKKGKWLNWCAIGAASIPNLFVFLALVDEIVGVRED